MILKIGAPPEGEIDDAEPDYIVSDLLVDTSFDVGSSPNVEMEKEEKGSASTLR
jgi:hypothetical protein